MLVDRASRGNQRFAAFAAPLGYRRPSRRCLWLSRSPTSPVRWKRLSLSNLTGKSTRRLLRAETAVCYLVCQGPVSGARSTPAEGGKSTDQGDSGEARYESGDLGGEEAREEVTTEQADQPPRFRWKCNRCGRSCDERITFDWGRTWAACSCGLGVDVCVVRDLTERVLQIGGSPSICLRNANQQRR